MPLPTNPVDAFRIQEMIRREFDRLGLDSAFAIRVANGESGFNPSAVGDAGESIGIFQLHARGLQPAFFQAGFTDLNDPLQQVQFVAAYVAQTRSWQPWTVARQLIGEGTEPDDGTTAQPIGAQGVGDNPFDVGGETAEEGRQGQLEADIEFLREQERLAQVRGDRESAQRYAREIALLERQLSFQGAEGALDRETQVAEAQKNREFNERLQRLSEANRLTETLLGYQQDARNKIVETIGKDPFRGAVMAQGGFAPGVTPLSRFREQLQTEADRPILRATGDESIEELQGITEQQQGLVENRPQLPAQLRGLRHGGTVGEKDLPVGAGILVGENAPEIMRFTKDGKVEIIPLVGGAQEGGIFGTGQPTARGAVQGLIPLFEAAGFNGELPIGTRTDPNFGSMFQPPSLGSGIGFPTQQPGQTADIFSRLGTPPRLIFIPEFNSLFTIDPSGEAQVLGDAQRAQELGFDIRTAQTMSYEQAKQMGVSPNSGGLSAQFEQESAMFQPRTGRFGARQPIFAPFEEGGQTGIFLPDPAQLAAIWDKQDNYTKSLAISAYGLANINEEELLDRMDFFRPTGTGSAARTALLR